jgi:uncharacterized membrane protein
MIGPRDYEVIVINQKKRTTDELRLFGMGLFCCSINSITHKFLKLTNIFFFLNMRIVLYNRVVNPKNKGDK